MIHNKGHFKVNSVLCLFNIKKKRIYKAFSSKTPNILHLILKLFKENETKKPRCFLSSVTAKTFTRLYISNMAGVL